MVRVRDEERGDGVGQARVLADALGQRRRELAVAQREEERRHAVRVCGGRKSLRARLGTLGVL